MVFRNLIKKTNAYLPDSGRIGLFLRVLSKTETTNQTINFFLTTVNLLWERLNCSFRFSVD
jgi:hypothetical protein